MSFKDLNHFQRMEEPEERKPEDLQRAKKGKIKHESRGGGTVSARTYLTTTRLLVIAFWLVLASFLGYGIYWLVQAFIGA